MSWMRRYISESVQPSVLRALADELRDQLPRALGVL